MLNTLGKRTKTNVERVECGREGEEKEENQVRNPAKSQHRNQKNVGAETRQAGADAPQARRRGGGAAGRSSGRGWPIITSPRATDLHG